MRCSRFCSFSFSGQARQSLSANIVTASVRRITGHSSHSCSTSLTARLEEHSVDHATASTAYNSFTAASVEIVLFTDEAAPDPRWDFDQHALVPRVRWWKAAVPLTTLAICCDVSENRNGARFSCVSLEFQPTVMWQTVHPGTTELTVISEASTWEMETITTDLHTEKSKYFAWTWIASRKKATTPSFIVFCAHLETVKSAVVNPEVETPFTHLLCKSHERVLLRGRT